MSETNNKRANINLIEQLQRRFVGLWKRLAGPVTDNDLDDEASQDYVNEFLANLKERAYLERTIANQYRGRYLLELIQNAVDAMQKQAQTIAKLDDLSLEQVDIEPEELEEKYRCRVELTPLALYVANDGQSFTAVDVQALCAMGQSTKPAGEYIGYKGLGFRAVLEITDSPEIYSGEYQFGFTKSETLALLEKSGEHSALANAELPVLSVPHSRSVNNSSLPESEQAVLARLQREGYATIVRLPFRIDNPYLYNEVRKDCQQLLTDLTMLFLPVIEELSVAIPDMREGSSEVTIKKSSRELTVRPAGLAAQVDVSRLTFRFTQTGEKLDDVKVPSAPTDWLLIAAHNPLPVAAELVAALNDPTWQDLRQVGMAIAYPLARLPWGGGEVFLKRRPEPLPFFAHFPTEESNGLGLAVNADFYLSASRKNIDGDVQYNRWLARELTNFICGAAMEAAHFLYPDDAALVEILADSPYHNDRFGRIFRDGLDLQLAATAFVPVGNGNYMQPSKVVWTPLVQEGVLIFRRVFRYPGDDLYYPVLQLEQVHATEPKKIEPESRNTDNADYYDSDVRHYDYDEDSYDGRTYQYDTDLYTDEVNSNKKSNQEEETFDYARVRRFLSSLGVKQLGPAALSYIFLQALQGWQNGLILTGEICAALALWYAALNLDFDTNPLQRRLLEEARNLPVLPTETDGWLAPSDTRFSFVDNTTFRASNLDPELQKLLGINQVSLIEVTAPDVTIVEISPDAYELVEHRLQVHRWHQELGVR